MPIAIKSQEGPTEGMRPAFKQIRAYCVNCIRPYIVKVSPVAFDSVQERKEGRHTYQHCDNMRLIDIPEKCECCGYSFSKLVYYKDKNKWSDCRSPSKNGEAKRESVSVSYGLE